MDLKQGKWQRHGIKMVPMSDYSGSQGLNSRLTESVKPFHPVLFVLQNRSGHALHGYAATWTLTDNAAKARVRRLNNWLFEGPARDALDLFISPFGILARGGVDASPLETNQEKMLPRPHESVSIELEFVLLDDGTALGPDAVRMADQARATIRAYQDLAQGLATIQSVDAAQAYCEGKVARPGARTGPAVAKASGPVAPISSSEKALRDHQSSLATMALHSLARGRDLGSVKATCAAQAAKMPDYNVHTMEEAQ